MNSVDSMVIIKGIVLAGALLVGCAVTVVGVLNVLFRELEKAEDDYGI